MDASQPTGRSATLPITGQKSGAWVGGMEKTITRKSVVFNSISCVRTRTPIQEKKYFLKISA